MRMETKAFDCTFFGHRDVDYSAFEEKIEKIVAELAARGVLHFINGGRGNFDKLCAKIVANVRQRAPQVMLTLARAYMPKENEELPRYFDDSVYLLERRVPPRFAIAETNKMIVQKTDIIISGVLFSFGGAYQAVRYAEHLGRTIIHV